MSEFVKIAPEDLRDNVFKLIGSDWMLITAGDEESFNTMTASWGGMGVLWNKNICICFIRPTRYTHKFMERTKYFTLTFFEEKYRDVLKFCGTHSGRDVDKVQRTGLTTETGPMGAVYFKEARLVIECIKIYFQDLIPKNFLSIDIDEHYEKSDYHRMYIGEINRVLIKE